jgi:hypothetical protein
MKKIACLPLVLSGERGPMGRWYDVLGIWRERRTEVTGEDGRRPQPAGGRAEQG